MRRLSPTSLRLIGTVCLAMIALEIVLPLAIITTYCLIEDIWTLEDLPALGIYLACLPLVLLLKALVQARLNGPIVTGLEAALAGAPDPALLERARRAALRAPRHVALSVMVYWSTLHPAILGLGMWLVRGHRNAWGEMFLSGMLIAPLIGTVSMLACEEVLRPAIRLLFPQGGLHLYPIAQSRTLAKRLTVVGMLWVYTLVVLIALTYRTLVGSGSSAESMQRLMRLDAFFLFSSLGMLGTLAFLSRRMMTEQLQQVLVALQRVHEGDLSVRLPLEVGDNLGILAERFNSMVQGLRERSHLQDAFGRYVSPEIARKAITGPLTMGGETREITVLFVDIRGFTALSEELTAEELVALMNRYFELVVGCIRTHGGHVNKFIGDGLMALFGAPETNGRHPEDAVRAALAITRALEAFNREQVADGAPELAIGIGIATGRVVIGNVGSRDRLEYTAMGNTVNLASRIEGLNKQLASTILVSERTYELVSDAFAFREQGTLFVKGKRDAVRVYSPEAAMVPLSV